MTKKIYDAFCGIFSYMMIILLGILTFISLISTTFVNDFDEVFYTSDRPYIHLLSLTLILGIGYLLFVKLKFRITDRTIFIVTALFVILAGIYITCTKLPPKFDQRAVRAVAGDLYYGVTYAYNPGDYAEIYPYQNGLVLFYEGIINIFGYENYVINQYINLLFIVLTETGLYMGLKKTSRYYREITMGFILFLPYWGFVTLLYGNIPGFACGVWAYYFTRRFLDDKKLWASIPAGALCSLACLFKLHFAILLIALGLFIIMDMLKKGGMWKVVLMASLIFFFLLGREAVDYGIESQIGHELTEGIPSLPYIAMGLHEHSERGAGWHDNYPENTYAEIGFDPDISDEMAKEDIRASLENFREHKAYMLGFFERKVASMWSEPTYYSWTLQEGRNEELDKKIYYPGIPYVQFFTDQFQTLLYLTALLYFIRHRKDKDFGMYFFALYFVGGFLCHLIWEAQCQYGMLYSMSLIPYSVKGCAETAGSIADLILSKDRKKIALTCSFIIALTLILSLPFIPDVLTLGRDDLRYSEYLSSLL
ncbi:MAG: hypothetical protein IJU43_00540 [Lachnospiraceae bacterium]|nr:hypothetical protein [Lachnospiraceae bacterium]